MAVAKAKKSRTTIKTTKTAVAVSKKKAVPATRVKAVKAKVVKKTSTASKVKAISVGKTPYNRVALVNAIMEHTNLEKKQVVAFFETLKDIIVAHLVKKGPGKFKLPGLLNLKIKDKPASKQRVGTNPFTGEEMIFAAKPARRTVKAVAVKKLKDLI
jgi:nucleoid DNA-binding protein